MTIMNLPDEVFREEAAIDALVSPATNAVSDDEELIGGNPGVFSASVGFGFVGDVCGA